MQPQQRLQSPVTEPELNVSTELMDSLKTSLTTFELTNEEENKIILRLVEEMLDSISKTQVTAFFDSNHADVYQDYREKNVNSDSTFIPYRDEGFENYADTSGVDMQDSNPESLEQHLKDSGHLLRKNIILDQSVIENLLRDGNVRNGNLSSNSKCNSHRYNSL